VLVLPIRCNTFCLFFFFSAFYLLLCAGHIRV
jgi:hypothetical protein